MIAPDWTSTSPNFSHMRVTGLGVVIHATRSGQSMNPSELEGTLNWFANPAAQVSAHWVIGRSGEKVRVVEDDCTAWHAGAMNDTHFGIELEQGIESDGFTGPQIEALVAVCRGYCEDFGVDPVHTLDDTVSGYIGHDECRQGVAAGKSDPGYMFDWDEFVRQLGGEAMAEPGTPGAPTNEQVAHAAHFAYTAWFQKNLDVLHPADRQVIQQVADWTKGQG